jgi:hypothetical protein
VAFVLVLLAAATFAAGIAISPTSNTLVYVSILFSLGAFVTLAIASLRARQAEREGAGVFATATTGTIDEAEAHAGPLLGGLDPTQLDMTPTWRRQGRGRRDVLDAELDDDEALESQLEDEEDEADFEVPVAPVAAVQQPDDLGWEDDDEDEDVEVEEPTAAYSPVFEDDVLDIPEPEPEPEPDAVASFFDEYDDLTAAEILPFLRGLDIDGLKWVRTRERSGAKRATVVNQVEQLIVEQGGKPSPAPRKRAAAKKAAPARRTAKKSTRRR